MSDALFTPSFPDGEETEAETHLAAQPSDIADRVVNQTESAIFERAPVQDGDPAENVARNV